MTMTDEEKAARDARWKREEELRAKEVERTAKANDIIAQENEVRQKIVAEMGGIEAWVRAGFAADSAEKTNSIRHHAATAAYFEGVGRHDERIAALFERCANAEERQATAWESMAQSLAIIASRD